MAEIVKAGNPVLKMVAKPVTVFDKKLKLLIAEMKKDMSVSYTHLTLPTNREV